MASKLDLRWEKNRNASVRRRELKKQAVEYKGGKCQICGYTGLPGVMDFHHLDPSTKEFSISNKVSSLAELLSELEKCTLLCCRCHREVHEGLHPEYLIHDGSFYAGGYEDFEEFDPDSEDFT